MTDHELVQRARNAGIGTDYYDWRGRHVEVPAETLTEILAVLDQPSAAVRFDAPAPARLAQPEQRHWGFVVQLYSVRSRQSWGHGDLHDLATLARWSGAELGAGYLLVNPLHAAEPLPPVSPSPYLPMTRLFTSPLYLRVEDIPEYEDLTEPDRDLIARLAAPLRAACTSAELIDRDAVWLAKRQALQLIRAVSPSAGRQAAYAQFLAARGAELRSWSVWCALAERHGPDWRDWPSQLADPAAADRLVAADPELAPVADFHAWLQWQADQQLATAQDAAKAAGMAYGIVHDLAVGVHPGGADVWSHQALMAAGFTVGAPPDGFNQRGQDWAQSPFDPAQLAAAGYQPLAELFGAALRHGGGIRVDHVMGLTRLWWVPAGQRPDQGAYVSYDHQAAVGALTGAAARAGAVAIGEDLGTVDPWIRDYLADHGVLGTMMLWFSHHHDGWPLPPADWRRGCMATVGTHDLPPASCFLTGEQVRLRARLGLLVNSEGQELAEAADMLERWLGALRWQGLLPERGPAGHPDALPGAAEFTVALYGYLSKTPALLLGVSLADAVGELRTQNVPGTSDEYPNWQIPLCDEQGRPVLIEELPGSPLLQAVCRAVQL